MKILKGIGNIIGILIAWVLSIALVIMLIVAPAVISALSLLTSETITDLIDRIFQNEEPVACAPAFAGTAMHGSSSGTSTLPTKPDGTVDWGALLGGATVPTNPDGSVDADALLGGETIPTIPTNPDGSVDVDEIIGNLTIPTTAPTVPAASEPVNSTTAPTQSALANGLSSLLGKESAEALLENIDQLVQELDLSAVEKVLGVEVSAETVEKVIHSNVTIELLEPYIEDITNAFVSQDSEKKFTEEKIVEIVEKNLDTIVDLILDTSSETNPEMNDKRDEVKIEIQAAISEYADDIVNALPQPEKVKEQIKEEIVANSPEMEEALDAALEILANREKINLALMAAVAVLALLIFICRIPGLRGFRWLATILFIAGIVNGLLGGGLLLNSALLTDTLSAEMTDMHGVIELFVVGFANNIVKQAGIMLGVAVVFSVIYKIVGKTARQRS